MKKMFFFKSGLVLLLCLSFVNLTAQVTLSTDFTSDTDKQEALHDIWDVANRISITNGSNVRVGTDINLVRMIGGIVKKVDGVKVPDLDYDPVSYDEVNDAYVYNWEPLLSRLRKIVNGQTKIHQLVLDQVPWAFQHGYTFIPEGQTDNVHFRENERVSIYGNSLPPADKEAYHAFIKAMMEKLVETFGEEEVLSWRFRVGSEIETPDHWFGTKQDFIDHFANTENAVRAVLPNAKVGLHTRTPGFLYKSGIPKNYKGEPFASFVDGLIEYCADSSVQYDFWGISDYVLINGEKYRDISKKYDSYFKAMQVHPKWNANCTLDMMEYSTVITMKPPDNGMFLNCATSHKDIVELGLSHMFYRKGIDKVFRWGLRNGADVGAIGELRQLVGHMRYETSSAGTPSTSSNELDAIFTKNEAGDQYDAIVYSYNAKSLNYVSDESVTLSFATKLPVGAKVFYRNNERGIEQNKLQQFLKKEGSQWVKSGWDAKGAPDRILTTEGYQKYQAFTDYKPLAFNEWKSVVTVANPDTILGSLVVLDTKVASFSYKKFEFRMESEFVTEISPIQVQWTTTEDFKPWKALMSQTVVVAENDSLKFNYQDGAGWQMVEMTGSNINSALFDRMKIVVKNTTNKAGLQMAANVPNKEFSTSRIVLDVPNDSLFHSVEVDLSTWALWQGTINQLKLYSNITGGSIVIDTLEFFNSSLSQMVDVTVEQEGRGVLNYSSGTCLAGQEFAFSAIAEPGWLFSEWTGDVEGASQQLNVKVDSTMTIKGVFVLARTLTVEKEGNGTLSHSSGIYKDGQALVLTASAASGWAFSGWTGDTVSIEDSLTITLDADFNIKAVFTEIFYNVTLEHEGQGSLNYSTGDYKEGQALALTATPASGWTFSGWTGDTISTQNPLTVSVDSVMTIKAIFVEEISAINDNQQQSLRIYPNPSTSSIFNVDVLPSQMWEVYNMAGVKVLTGRGGVINLSSFPKGMYLFIMNNTVTKIVCQ